MNFPSLKTASVNLVASVNCLYFGRIRDGSVAAENLSIRFDRLWDAVDRLCKPVVFATPWDSVTK